MELLNRLMALQAEQGALGDDLLRRVAREERVPLYRLEGLRSFYPAFRREPAAGTEIRVCRDLPCVMAAGEADPVERVRAACAGDGGPVTVTPVSCLGRCDAAPAALVHETPVAGDAPTLAACARGERPLPEPAPPPADPHPIDPYAAPGERYGVLRRLLGRADAAAAREEVIAALEAAGLRGMGGAGFPTGRKWAFTRRAAGEPRYVVCNADESEPGTFKDRELLARWPHLVIEAMAIAGWVVGAREGIVYIRHEYAPERRVLERAIADAESAGLLGADGAGSGFRFDLRVFVSPGGYILGEETALLEALEDKRGEPRNKPPFPTTHGLWGRPTVMNNVETLAFVPAILHHGPEWWAAQGVRGSRGWKFVSVSGDVARPGVHGVPAGTTAAELIERCGGMAGGRALLGFMPGGVSADFLAAGQADVPMDFGPLQEAGSMLGSGGLIVLGTGRDPIALAANAVAFFRNESCGKCVPCRVGSAKAVALLEEALAGRPPPGLRGTLDELGATLRQTSICGLGQVALQPVLSAMRRFPEAAARTIPDDGDAASPGDGHETT